MYISLETFVLSNITVTGDEMLRQMGVNSELVFMFDMMNRLNIDMDRVSKDSKESN